MSEKRPTKSRGAPAGVSDETAKTEHTNLGPPDETPLDYMLRIMRDADAEDSRRDAMAKSACAYVHSRSAEAETGIMNTEEFRNLMEAARGEIGSRIARIRAGQD